MSETLDRVPGALDKLVRLNPTQVGNFVLSANIVREAALSAGEALMILPERGAMPIYWTADGRHDDERPISRDGLLQLPIGSYDFFNLEGNLRKGTLSNEQKRAIVGRHAQVIHDAERILIIDEVQKGGTLTELVTITEDHRESSPSRMYVIAAQDSRTKVAAERKVQAYQEMVAGNRGTVSANVVPMPLFSTDCDVLLNSLWYRGNTRIPSERDPSIIIRRNGEAELIFRTLGMAARNREALEDTTVIDDAIFHEFALGDKAAGRVEQWREMLINQLRNRFL